jgi:hypothetical protein
MKAYISALLMLSLLYVWCSTLQAAAQTTSPTSDWRAKLTAEAKRLKLTHIEQFENGIYGRYMDSRMFFTTAEQIPDDKRLYWAMVKVLSEKFACFMVRKRKSGDLYRFYCKDKRSVVFRKGRVGQTIHFYGRTYDRNEKLIPLDHE